MKKIVFHKRERKEREKGLAMVGLDIDLYRRVLAIADETDLPIVRIVSDMVAFALKHTEVRNVD